MRESRIPRVSNKPKNYGKVSPELMEQLESQYRALVTRTEVTLEEIWRRLMELRGRNLRRRPNKAELSFAYEPLYENDDVRLRAMLFLLHEQGRRFSRKTLRDAIAGDHNLSDKEIAEYVHQYPFSIKQDFESVGYLNLLSCHEDDLARVAIYCPYVKYFHAEMVVRGVVYLISEEDGRDPMYVSLRTGEMQWLDTHDYNDGLYLSNYEICYIE